MGTVKADYSLKFLKVSEEADRVKAVIKGKRQGGFVVVAGAFLPSLLLMGFLSMAIPPLIIVWAIFIYWLVRFQMFSRTRITFGPGSIVEINKKKYELADFQGFGLGGTETYSLGRDTVRTESVEFVYGRREFKIPTKLDQGRAAKVVVELNRFLEDQKASQFGATPAAATAQSTLEERQQVF